MAEQENGSSPLAEALASVGDRWTLLVVEALLTIQNGRVAQIVAFLSADLTSYGQPASLPT